MNLYSVTAKRSRVTGLQLEEEYFLVVGKDVEHAKGVVAHRLDASRNGIALEAERCKDGQYFICHTFIVDNFS